MSRTALSVRDVENVGFILTTVSPSARKMIDMETWRTFVSSDEGDADHILPLLFQCVITDLETIGVTCDVEYEALSLDPVAFFAFINLIRLILPNTLYPFVQDNDRARKAILSISDGSFSTGQSAIVTWLDLIAGPDGLPGLADGFRSIVQQIRSVTSSDERFMNYLLTLENNIGLSRLVPRLDHEATSQFIEVFKACLWRQVAVEDKVASLIPQADQATVARLVKRFSRDVISPDDLVMNRYLFLNSEATLPSDLHFSYKERWTQFKASHPLFETYYVERSMEMTATRYCLCVMGLAIISKTREVYQESLRSFLERNPQAADLFSSLDLESGIYE